MAVAPFKYPLSDTAFWRGQRDGIRAPHVAPINRFVDSLAEKKDQRIPYVPPIHGGTDARVLSILRDPGPMTDRDKGTGLVSVCNPDQTAAKQLELFGSEGVELGAIIPWNAYPWYINRAPNTAEKAEGARVLRELLDLLPRIEIVFLQGGDAAETWRKFESFYPGYAAERALVVINSLHPSQQALWHKDPAERERRVQRRIDAYHRLGALLRGEDVPPTVQTGPGSEAGVEKAFADYLLSEGWDVQLQVDYCDVVATKDGVTIKAEVKGRTGASMGLDVDTLFGQLLRRFPADEDASFVPAVVVPSEALGKIECIPAWVLEKLQIKVFTVDNDGAVEERRMLG